MVGMTRLNTGYLVGVVASLLVAACGQAALLVDEGQCFDNPDGRSEIVTNVDIVDCDDPHDNEMYAVVAYPDQGSHPGDDVIRDFADETCIQRFEEFVGFDYLASELDLGYFWPTDESWDAGDRTVQCFVFELDGSQSAGTLQGAAR